jgi:hypothetical protein
VPIVDIASLDISTCAAIPPLFCCAVVILSNMSFKPVSIVLALFVRAEPVER